MVAKETYEYHPIDGKERLFHSEDSNEADEQQEEEKEETLSLCDLPIHSDSFRWDDYSKEDQTSSSDNENDNIFEFFSADFDFSSSAFPDDVIFCGKLIPSKERHVAHEKTPKFNQAKKAAQDSTRKFNFRWKSHSFSTKTKRETCPKESRSSIDEERRDFSVGKVSVFGSSAKTKWYLLMFGLGRFPVEMELKDMKTRQSRRGPASMIGSSGDGDFGNDGKNRRGKGLWRVLRALVCSSQHQNAVVEASYGCMTP